MEMHQVRYFLAVCRTLNFTKAAEECNVAQPSLTRAVQKLEEELGGPLFHRERANTHLTELGRMMLPHLEQTFTAAQAAKSLAVSVRKGEVAPLRLGIDSSVRADSVIATLADLRKSIKGFELTLGSGPSLEIIDEVLEGDFDLVVTGQKGDLPDRMRSWVLFREPCNVMVSKDHRFAKKKAVAIHELEGEPIIERTGCCLTPAFRALCEAAGVMPDVRHRAATEEHLQHLVLAGFGCGIVPRTLPVAAGLVSVPLEGNTLEREVVVATVAGRRFSLAADAFVKVVRARDWSDVR